MTPSRLQRLLAVLPPLFLLANLASADAITGRVVDSNGVGVAGVDIDFVRLGGGGNPHEANDGTDANGNFLTTVDPGVYQVLFFAPPPPTTTLLTGSLPSVVVSGTVNLGTITLVNGAAVQGTVLNASSFPVGSVKVDVFDAATGTKHPLKNNTTSAFGTFNIAVPKNVDLRFDFLTSNVVGQTLVPERHTYSFTGSTNLGNLQFATGFHLTGRAIRENGTPVAGANVDVADATTNVTLFTPGDNTTTLGTFDVVVPAGLFDVDVLRPTALTLVGVGLNNVSVSAATNLGDMVMRNGVFLSGTVRDRKNVPVQGADVNVYEVATGTSLTLGSDNTNAAGFYSVVVPLGLMDVVFSPPGPHKEWRKDWHLGVNVTASMTLNGRLPSAPSTVAQDSTTPKTTVTPTMLPFGAGTPGASGVPHVQGALRPTGTTLWLGSARPGASAQLWLGLEQDVAPGVPELHLVRPMVRLPVSVDAAGNATITLPGSLDLIGRTAFAQFAVLDPDAPRGVAVSHVLAIRD